MNATQKVVEVEPDQKMSPHCTKPDPSPWDTFRERMFLWEDEMRQRKRNLQKEIKLATSTLPNVDVLSSSEHQVKKQIR
jgi:hypothetical protein